MTQIQEALHKSPALAELIASIEELEEGLVHKPNDPISKIFGDKIKEEIQEQLQLFELNCLERIAIALEKLADK